MKLLHTADWHLGDRLGRIDRTEDLRKAVERVAKFVDEHAVDVLIVAGDLFSELSRADALRETIRHWQEVFATFLARGGTILTLTGNHDNENFCRTLTHAMSLAAPMVGTIGERVPPGRLYLAAEPTFLVLRDPTNTFDVQFLLMPYPTPTRYLKGEAGQKYHSGEEKNRLLVAAFQQTLHDLQQHAAFDKSTPAVLAAHAHVRGAQLGAGLFRINIDDDVLVSDTGLAEQFAYVALGHIHKPQTLGGHAHVRYSGSIERLDLGEQTDSKSVVLFELGPKGLVGEPTLLPLPSSPIYEIIVADPETDLPNIRADHPDADADLVNLHIRYTAGKDQLEELLKSLDQLFPRWYARDWTETGSLGATLVVGEADRNKNFADTVRDYLGQELQNHSPEDQAELLKRAEELLKEME